ncbi:MAG: Wzz/FepE/Etk N-terminal domain-containing protein [Pseudomonadota bacterium]|nr:Wzz/FepE/Etk N-terminal domain-containing protein [Pseudomonadota bacterium]
MIQPKDHTSPVPQPVAYILSPTQAPLNNTDEINLLELLSQFLERWRWWVGGLLLGGLLGLAAGFLVPPKYESNGVVRIGQVTGTLIESVSETIARMQTLAFRNEVIERLNGEGVLTDGERERLLSQIGSRGAVTQVKDASYISITLQTESQGFGSATINTMVKLLQERQQPLMNERILQFQKDIEQTKATVVEMEKRFEAVAAATHPLNNASPQTYLELARMSEAGTNASLRQRLLELQNSLLPPSTRPTALVEPVATSDRPTSPKKSMIAIGGALLGFVLGTLLAFGLRAWSDFQRRKQIAVDQLAN